MSLFHPVNLVCPSCKATITMEAVGSVNADRRPDFREAILADAFQDTPCKACGKSFRLQPEFNYLDAGRGQWIAGMPADRMPHYLATEDEVTDLFAKSYGKLAPKAAQDVGGKLTMRLTFGWPAIREKLLARAHDLDDTVLEMMKLDLLRRLPSAPMKQGVELRLVAVTEAGQFVMSWLHTATEEVLQQLQVERALYDAIAANTDGWAKIRGQLENGPFVDIQKLYMGEGRAAM